MEAVTPLSSHLECRPISELFKTPYSTITATLHTDQKNHTYIRDMNSESKDKSKAEGDGDSGSGNHAVTGDMTSLENSNNINSSDNSNGSDSNNSGGDSSSTAPLEVPPLRQYTVVDLDILIYSYVVMVIQTLTYIDTYMLLVYRV
jgi:hypothetical protein